MKGKPQFEYHQQTLEYIQRKLTEIPKADIGHTIDDDLQKPELSSKLRILAGPMGFEPMTFSLEG